VEASRVLAPTPQARRLELARLRRKPAADRAFEELYERHAREIYQYALALLTNPADAEDVTQTTFLNAYRALQRGERPVRPHNWLIAIAHNVCRMHWRQAGHRPREVALDDAPEPAAPEHDPPSIDAVLEALSHLTFNQRAAIVMRELEGRSCSEIADTLGLSVSAVEALLFRARRSLQLKRKALGVLGTAPLPGSLTSAFGLGGGGAAAVGGAAVGADVTLKTAALLAAAAITAGAVAVAVPKRHHAQPSHALQLLAQTPSEKTPASPAKRPQARAHPRSVTRARPLRVTPQAAATVAPTHVAEPRTEGSASPPAIQPPSLPKLPELPKPPALPKLPPIPPLPIGVTPPKIPPLPPK
jgi:RNA polymerase sigma-70 factor, ECF subfamily